MDKISKKNDNYSVAENLKTRFSTPAKSNCSGVSSLNCKISSHNGSNFTTDCVIRGRLHADARAFDIIDSLRTGCRSASDMSPISTQKISMAKTSFGIVRVEGNSTVYEEAPLYASFCVPCSVVDKKYSKRNIENPINDFMCLIFPNSFSCVGKGKR